MPEAKAPPLKVPNATGLTVIEASAGTGKTWTIAHLVPLWLVRGTVERLDEMVLVTFTEAAAAELAERVRRTLGALVDLVLSRAEAPPQEPGLAALLEELRALPEAPAAGAKRGPRAQAVHRLQGALEEADRLLVCTIHSFCRRVLSDESFLCRIPAGFEVLQDPGPLRERGVRDAWRSKVEGDPLVALVAAAQRWSLEDDFQLVRAVAGKADLRAEPDLDFDALRRSLASEREALGRHRLELKDALARVEALEAKGAGLNKAGSASKSRVADWIALLDSAGLGPPEPALFGAVEGILELPKWLSQSKGNATLKADVKAAIADFKALPLLAHAEAFLERAESLRWAWLNAARRACEKALEKELRRANALTYDGLVQSLREALVAGDPGLRADLLRRLRRRWKVALVDESQDTDPAQLEIFRAIFASGSEEEHRLVLVGDPKQAIYGFRGADLRAYLKARGQAREQLVLVDTYRSAPGLVRALNALWDLARPALGHVDLEVPPARAARPEGDLPLPESADSGDGSEPRLVAAFVPEAQREAWGSAEKRRGLAAAATASEIVAVLGRRMGEGRVLPGHCAVLTASHRDARLVQAELTKRRVSSVLVKAGNVFLTEEAEELRTLCKAVLDPRDAWARRAALATRLIGLRAEDLGLLSPQQEEGWHRSFAQWKETWRRGGLAALTAAMDLHPQACCLRNLARGEGGERRITDFKHLLDLAAAEESLKRLPPEALLQWLESGIAGADDRNAPEAHLRRLEKDGSAVQILTMHSAKGLEFDLVFCPNLWESAWEGQARRTKYSLAQDADAGWVLFDRKRTDPARAAAWSAAQQVEELREDLRLAYVALTRAKRRVWFLAGWIAYLGDRAATLPSALDWLLRDTDQADAGDPSAWLERLRRQKGRPRSAETGSGPLACEHEAALRRLQAAAPGLVAITQPRISPAVYTAEAAVASLPEAAVRTKAGFGEWSRLSYSSFVRGAGEDEDAWKGEENLDAWEEGPAGGRLLLADLPGGKNTGNCLHWLLEHWDFRGDPQELIARALRRFGLDVETGPPARALLAEALPRWAQAKVPVLEASLAEAAGDPKLSELRFLLPLKSGGLSGEDLAELFERHGDAPWQRYGATLRSLPRSAWNGMLEGSIDRLARVGRRWAVLDWKSNRPGDFAGHFSPSVLWSLAAQEHYLLQLLLYMVVTRRYLAQRGQGDTLVAGGLAFLRGMDAGAERGLLMLEPPEPLLEALDALFVPGSRA